MIKVENLTKRYGRLTAVDRVSFEVGRGQIVGFLGPNGAGKTTTMRILTCFFPPTEGRAEVAGFDVFENPLEVRRRIGYLPENVPLYRDMTVEGYLGFVSAVKSGAGDGTKARVEKVMDECGIRPMAGRVIKTLSRGYQQRVGLAQALVNDPEILILDEPTIGLDPRQIVEIRNLIKNLAGKRTVILSSHILPEVSQICERVIIISNGRIVAQDTPENLTRGAAKGGAVSLKVRGEGAKAAALLGRVPGVKTVETVSEENGTAHLNVACGDTDARAQIAEAVVRNGLGLLELTARSASLEDVFVKLVTAEKPEEEAGQGGNRE